jgi:hypothetical protein
VEIRKSILYGDPQGKRERGAKGTEIKRILEVYLIRRRGYARLSLEWKSFSKIPFSTIIALL